MSGARNLTRDVDLDIAGLLAAVWRRKMLVLLLSVIGTGLLFAALTMIKPRYQSEARIIIERQESIFTRIRESEFVTIGGFDEQTVGSQVQVLTSDDLALKVIDKLDLANHPDFAAKGSGGVFSLVGRLFTGSGNANVSREQRILTTFRERLDVHNAEKTRVIVINYWSHDRELARAVPNALAEEYISQIRSIRSQSDEAATEWLAPEIADLRAKLLQAEAKVAEYRATSDLLLADNNALLATQQLSEVSSEYSRVRAARTAAEAKMESIRQALDSGLSVDTIPEVIASQLVQRLRERKATVEAQISELSTTLLPNHPRIKALQSQLPEFDRQIREAARDILASLEGNADLARKQESVLTQEINRLKAESARVGEAEVELRALEREAASQRELLETYLNRYREAAGRQERDYVPVDARIISRATLPVNSFFPKVLPYSIAGGISLLVLTIVGVLAVELLSGRGFKPVNPVTEGDVPERVIIPDAPSIVPAASDLLRDEARTAAHPMADLALPADAANDAEIFGLGFAIRAIEGLGKATISVVSPGGDRGSLATWQLARHLASGKRSVVVADLTGDGITAREMIGTEGVPGLHDVLSGRSTLRNVLFQDHASDAHVLAAGNEEGGPIEPGRLTRIAEALAESYDYVIFDCGPAGLAGLARIATPETIILVPTVDADLKECRALERRLRAAGMEETILVRMDGTQQVHERIRA